MAYQLAGAAVDQVGALSGQSVNEDRLFKSTSVNQEGFVSPIQFEESWNAAQLMKAAQ